MHARRLLFVRARPGARLSPVYAALLTLTVLCVIGLAMAYWPKTAQPSQHPTRGELVPAHPPIEGSLRVPPEVRQQRGRGRWM